LLDFPMPRLKAYRPETAIAEKLHAMVILGEANSRMRDSSTSMRCRSITTLTQIFSPALCGQPLSAGVRRDKRETGAVAGILGKEWAKRVDTSSQLSGNVAKT